MPVVGDERDQRAGEADGDVVPGCGGQQVGDQAFPAVGRLERQAAPEAVARADAVGLPVEAELEADAEGVEPADGGEGGGDEGGGEGRVGAVGGGAVEVGCEVLRGVAVGGGVSGVVAWWRGGGCAAYGSMSMWVARSGGTLLTSGRRVGRPSWVVR